MGAAVFLTTIVNSTKYWRGADQYFVLCQIVEDLAKVLCYLSNQMIA